MVSTNREDSRRRKKENTWWKMLSYIIFTKWSWEIHHTLPFTPLLPPLVRIVDIFLLVGILDLSARNLIANLTRIHLQLVEANPNQANLNLTTELAIRPWVKMKIEKKIHTYINFIFSRILE